MNSPALAPGRGFHPPSVQRFQVSPSQGSDGSSVAACLAIHHPRSAVQSPIGKFDANPPHPAVSSTLPRAASQIAVDMAKSGGQEVPARLVIRQKMQRSGARWREFGRIKTRGGLAEFPEVVSGEQIRQDLLRLDRITTADAGQIGVGSPSAPGPRRAAGRWRGNQSLRQPLARRVDQCGKWAKPGTFGTQCLEDLESASRYLSRGHCRGLHG